MFNPNRSLFAGQNQDVLRAKLAAAQLAYADLSMGKLGVSFQYAQGDGSKSVTYNATNLPALANLIQLLQVQLGIVAQPRRATRFRF
jgi:hypothetical protein